MGRLGDFAVSSDLLQSVDSLAVGAQSVHQMHGGVNIDADAIRIENQIEVIDSLMTEVSSDD